MFLILGDGECGIMHFFFTRQIANFHPRLLKKEDYLEVHYIKLHLIYATFYVTPRMNRG